MAEEIRPQHQKDGAGPGGDKAESPREDVRAQVRRLREEQGLLSSGEIREERLRIGLSQKDLASQLGAAEATVSRWESDTMIQSRAMDNLLRLYFRLPEVRAHLAGGGEELIATSSPKEEHMTDDIGDLPKGGTPCDDDPILSEDEFDPWGVAGAVDAAGDKRKIALLVGPAANSPNVFVLAKLHLWAGRAIYLYNLLDGKMKHIPRPPQQLIDKYLALGRRINHPPGIQAGDNTRWIEYGRKQAQALGLKVAK